MAAGTLVGADDEAAATRLLAAIEDLADAGLRGKVARWLHDLYPASEPGSAHGEWIGPLRPDLVAEHLVVKALTGHTDLTRAMLSGLIESRATSALTTLARAALGSRADRPTADRSTRSHDGCASPRRCAASSRQGACPGSLCQWPVISSERHGKPQHGTARNQRRRETCLPQLM